MSNSLFCPNCGMLKTNCTCGNSSNKKSKGPTNLFSFKKPISHSILDDEIRSIGYYTEHQ